MRWALLAAALIEATSANAQRLLFAGGQWAAIDRGASCEAASRALGGAASGKPQARAGFAFDAAGPRQGQFFAELSAPPRPGSTVILTVGTRPFLLVAQGRWAWSRGAAQDSAIIAATRAAGGMRIESRDSAGRRIVERYLLEGAATAIDAAAAACAGKSAPR
jgi:hypothetical protein